MSGTSASASPAISSIDEARRVLAEAGAMALVPAAGMPSLVAGVVGGPVRGSWWSHPKGGLIYQIATGLEDDGDTLVAKLVDGKVAFVHRRLWPALARVVTDEAWRTARRAGLSAEAAAVLAAVEASGELPADAALAIAGDKRRLAAARKALEARALVHSTSVHTERGHHAAVLTSWAQWAPRDVVTAARRLKLDASLAALAAVGIQLGAAPVSIRAVRAARAPRTRSSAGRSGSGTGRSARPR